MIDLDKYRESLAKYCYDLSKVIATLGIINPLMVKNFRFTDIVIAFITAIGFLALAIIIERGKKDDTF